MALTPFNGSFSFKQDTIARLGRDRGTVKKMTKEEYERFCNSPAMKDEAYRDETVRAKTSKRDLRRMETDPSFKPQDSDWDANPAFAFDYEIDYYCVLGIDEYETLENVKKAFRRLSLVYHPDKTTGFDEEIILEYKSIFMELNHAYMVLGDNVTRRQYDRARDNKRVIEEMFGQIGKKRKQFDALATLEELAKKKPGPSKTVDVVVMVKLEKMFYGGVKSLTRPCRIQIFESITTEQRLHNMVVPARCRDGYKLLQKGAGDHHEKSKPDHLNFIFKAKPHPRFNRKGDHLELNKVLHLGRGALRDAIVRTEVDGLDGRIVLLFGRNPFYGIVGAGTCRLHVAIKGEGFAQNGALKFDLAFPGKEEDKLVTRAMTGKISDPLQTVVAVTNSDTGGTCYIATERTSTVQELTIRLSEVLGLPTRDASNMRLTDVEERPSGTRGPAKSSSRLKPSEKVGSRRAMECHGCRWTSPKITQQRTVVLIHCLDLALRDVERYFALRPEPLIQTVLLESHMASLDPPSIVQHVLPHFGFAASKEGMEKCMHACQEFAPGAVTEMKDRIHAVAIAELGGAFRPAPRQWFARLGLRTRSYRGQGLELECTAELEPFGSSLQFATTPTCYLRCFGNLRQPASITSTTHVRPRPLFAIVLSCPKGAKKFSRQRWQVLKEVLVPLLRQTFWVFVAPSRSLHPKALDRVSAFYEDDEEEGLHEIETLRCGSYPINIFTHSKELSPEQDSPKAQMRVRATDIPDSHRPDPNWVLWEVVGGQGKGGILVRAGKELSSQEMADRLSTGALVRGLEMHGERLYYEKFLGDGPTVGWVTVTVSGKPLLKRTHASKWEIPGRGGLSEQVAQADVDEYEPADLPENVFTEREQVPSTHVMLGERGQSNFDFSSLRAELYPRTPRRLRQQRAKMDNLCPPPSVPWMRLGAEACRRHDMWIAHNFYSKMLSEVGFHDVTPLLADAAAGGAIAIDIGGIVVMDVHVAATALAKRSECLEYLGYVEDALLDARSSVKMQPNSSEFRRRVGVLAAKLGNGPEAWDALFKAVQFDARNSENVRALQKFRWQQNSGRAAAREQLMAGSSNFKTKVNLSIAHYTAALSAMQAPLDHNVDQLREEDARLLAEIHSNRSAAFAKLAMWAQAIADAERALTLPGREDWAKGLVRMGTALLGAGQHEEAYPYFARAEALLPNDAASDAPARLGRQACLTLTPLWKSRVGQARLAKFWCNARRPRNSIRVFAISDIHFDHPRADDWVHSISNTKFQDDVLIVAGDVAENLLKLRECLRILRAKFDRVFFTPGNHDLWIHTMEEKEIRDSIDKLFRILRLCDELDVDVFPGAVCEGLFIVPLFSWYNAEFDVDDPFPASFLSFDRFAKWPMDKDEQLWRYMLYLNRRILELPYPGSVITFSHFLPRTDLPFWNHVAGLAKAVGCPQLDAQIRQVRSEVHVFGHSHWKCDQVLDGVRYVQCPLGYEQEHERYEPLRCVYDGAQGLISQTVSIRY